MNDLLKLALTSLWRAGALIAAIVILAPLAANAQEQRIVVLVNDTPISAYDIQQRVRLLAVTTRQKPSKALQKKATEELIAEAIQLQEARKSGIAVGKEEVDRALGSVAQRNKMTGPKLLAALGQLGVHEQTIKQKFEAQIAWQRFVRAKFRNQVLVGDAQVDQALSDQKPKEGEEAPVGKQKTEFRLQRVRLELPDNPDQKTIAKRLVEAERLRARVKTCDQLNDAIRRLSKTTVKALGRKTADQIVQPSRALLTAAEAGRLTPAFVTSSGVELYAVCGRRTVQAADTKQRERVQAQLVGKEFEILAVRHLRDLRQEAYVEYR